MIINSMLVSKYDTYILYWIDANFIFFLANMFGPQPFTDRISYQVRRSAALSAITL